MADKIVQNICIVTGAAMIYMSVTASLSTALKVLTSASPLLISALSHCSTISNSKEVVCIYLWVVSMILEAASDFPNLIMLLLQH